MPSSDSARANQHRAYHEAARRAQLSQPIARHSKPQALLLPAPNNIVFELFGTVLVEPSSDSLLSYVSANLLDYLEATWTSKMTQRVVSRLRREQALDTRAGLLLGAPVIGPVRALGAAPGSPGQQVGSRDSAHSPSQRSEPAGAQQVFEHVMWRIRNNAVSQIVSLLVKLLLDDAYKRTKLKAQAYQEVGACFEDWRANKLIKLYAFGNAPASDQKLLLASTSAGNLARWVANYIDGSEKQTRPDLLRKLVDALRDKSRNCIYLTNELADALQSIRSASVRCALLLDRLDLLKQPETLATDTCELIRAGKLYIITSLDCVLFAPDPTSDNCC